MMLAISNIAWNGTEDAVVYPLLRSYRLSRLEAAPGRLVSEDPYGNRDQGSQRAQELEKTYGLRIASLQAILFGRPERLFGTGAERRSLGEQLEGAFAFAQAVGCGNLVFGSPKNRKHEPGEDTGLAVLFFRDMAEKAQSYGTVLNLEANPAIYGTNYINYTQEAVRLIREVDHPSFALNLDVGTMITNGETVEDLSEAWSVVRHIHISEPHLAPIVPRDLHRRLLYAAGEAGYLGSVSVEMKRDEADPVGTVERALEYMSHIMEER